MERRRFLAAGAALGVTGLAGCTIQREPETGRQDGTRIGLETVVEGAHFPTALEFLPNGDGLILERFGVVLRLADEGLAEQPFLSVRDRMAEVEGERGLLGIALHPEFASNRKFYLRYSAPTREWMADGEYSHTAVLSEFRATEEFTGFVPGSERILLEVPEPGAQHNAGALAFGPEGYLYVALGDGRRTDIGDDGWSWWYDQGQNAQNLTDNVLGGILRIDVDNPTEEREYSVPSDNPLVGEEGRDEYYAWGLRNPYRISFDGDRLFVGDVGEHTRESVYIVERGSNCGWPIVEGSSCSSGTSLGHKINENPANAFNPKTWLAQVNRISPYKVCPTPATTSDSFVNPIVEYQRPGSRAVTGGYVYRGEGIPELQGKYVFGDLMPPAPIFAAEPPESDGDQWNLTELVVDSTENGRLENGDSILSFARDPQGEVYVLTSQYAEGSGKIRRLVSSA